MAELILSRDARLRLKSQSHPLKPVVLLGAHGLSEPVFKEIDRALNAHGLIKVRVPGTDKEEREALFLQVAERLGAARVQLIGRLMVLFRPMPEKQEKPSSARARPAPRTPLPRSARARTEGVRAKGNRQVPGQRKPAGARSRLASRGPAKAPAQSGRRRERAGGKG